MGLHRPSWLTRWSADPAVRVGVAGASWSIAGSFARGLLPRSPIDQAVASGVVAATNYQLSATAWAVVEALASHPGRRPNLPATIAVAGAAIAGGLATNAFGQRFAETSMPAAAVAAAGRRFAFAGLAGLTGAVADDVLVKRLKWRPGLDTTLVPSILTGTAVAGFTVLARSRRASKHGIVDPDRHGVHSANGRALAQASAVGVGSALALTGLTLGEQFAARGLERLLSLAVRRETGAIGSLIAHTTVLAAMGAVGTLGLHQITERIQKRDDIVEPAYPAPPTNPHVSAGPVSAMPFDALGKEGRRFVLMALNSADISAVMGEDAVDPVRVVGGYGSASSIDDRARMILEDMKAVGAFDRSLIAVAAPTGVGYFNYTVAEALEYLTRGDCASVVPQYALVPSALALARTHEGCLLTRLVLEGIKEHSATLPADKRPRVVLIGESLGALVALDVATLPGPYVGVPALDHLGVSGGMYLGVPFLTEFWKRWREHPSAIDPQGRVDLVAEPDEASPITPATVRHLMIVHHDDPVTMFSFRMVLQPPWWMGPPATRPPLVPRETKFRPITTFILTTMDLKNAMQSKPGTFIRLGHDYRIEARMGLERAFGLVSSTGQAEAIEAALRQRETVWAARRMVARKMDRARRSIEKTLAQWGAPAIDVADLDPAQLEDTTGPLARLANLSGPPGS